VRRGVGVLTLGAAMSFIVALLHLAMIPIGVEAYDFFTAPTRFVELARRGSPVPPLFTLLLAAIFTTFGFCALSAAGRAPRLPHVRIVLIFICGIYLLRGLVVVPELLLYLHTSDIPGRALVFSLISLLIGMVYTVGLALRWPALPTA
jgi:putative oxidoreductase